MSLDYVTLTDEAIHSCAIEAREMNLVKLLSPRIFIDGSAWCVLYGDDLQNGVAGFGETPRLAVYAFNKAWDAELPRTSADHESERNFLLSALGRIQEMTKDSHPVAYGIAEHAIEYTRRRGA